MRTFDWYFLVFPLLTAANSADDTLIQTPLGSIRGLGLTDKVTGENVFHFRGIRFGKAPIGQGRFRKPEGVDAWEGVYDATKFGPACAQNVLYEDGSENQSEDCLYLNLYVPQSSKNGGKLSVMVWIYGGGFFTGNGFSYDGTRLAVDGGVIVVTFNYRMGVFGFLGLHHPASRGNYGLWDQILALQWVHDNIASFGGDPDSVTIFGESAGGFSASYLSLIPSNEGLFQRAIAMSGVASTYIMPRAKEIKKIIKLISERTECPADDLYVFVECLRSASVEVLLNATDFFQDIPEYEIYVEILYAPVIDGELFPAHPIVLLQDQNSPQSKFFSSIDFITGTTSQEGSLIYMSIMPSAEELYGFNVTDGITAEFTCSGMAKPFVDSYYDGDKKIQEAICKRFTSKGSPNDQSNLAADLFADMMFTPYTIDMLNFHSRMNSARTYQYQISREKPNPYDPPPPGWFKGCGHGDELIYFFYGDNGVIFDYEISESDKNFAKTLIAYWTSFAKTGIPSAGETHLPWLEYDQERQLYIDFDDNMSLRQRWKTSNVNFWLTELPRMPMNAHVRLLHDEL